MEKKIPQWKKDKAIGFAFLSNKYKNIKKKKNTKILVQRKIQNYDSVRYVYDAIFKKIKMQWMLGLMTWR